MPIWFELMVLLLATYILGLAIGWSIWGMPIQPIENIADEEEDDVE